MFSSVADVDGPYMAIQSAKGTAANALKGTLHYSKLTKTVDKTMNETGPALGAGNRRQPGFNGSFKVTSQYDFVLTLDRFLAHFFEPMAGRTSTVVSPGVNQHVWAEYFRNSTKPYLSVAHVLGATGMGAGVAIEKIRDARLTGANFKIAAGAAPSGSLSFTGLNEGIGDSTNDTYAFDTAYNMPIPSDPTSNSFSFPSFFPSSGSLCCTEIDATWTDTTQDGPACLGSGELSDTYGTNQFWTLKFGFTWDANDNQVYNWVNYLTNTGLDKDRAIRPGFIEGAFSFSAAGQNVIPSTVVKPSLGMSFPSLQWTKANRDTGQAGIMLSVEAISYGDWTATGINGKSGSQMAL